MSAGRMAGFALKPLLASIGRGVKEVVPTKPLDIAMSLGPDLAFAGLTAFQGMPKDATLAERLGAGAFDLAAFGLVPSLGGRLAGRALGGAFKLGPGATDGLMNATEMVGQMSTAFLGLQNPISSAAFHRSQEREMARLAEEEELKRRQEAAIAGAVPYGLAALAAGTGAGRAAPSALDYSGLG